MIIKILGILDIVIALCFWLFGMFQLEFMSPFILVLGLFLLAKGIAFLTTLNWISALDILSAILIIITTAFFLPKIIIILISLFLLQKGIFSLLG